MWLIISEDWPAGHWAGNAYLALVHVLWPAGQRRFHARREWDEAQHGPGDCAAQVKLILW